MRGDRSLSEAGGWQALVFSGFPHSGTLPSARRVSWFLYVIR